MAIELSAKTNVQAPDSDYPYGQIKDDTGSGDGTPVDAAVYGDFHQFFARMFALSGLNYNGLPDNDYSGFQYIEAANKLWKTFDGVKIISANTILTVADKSKLIIVNGTSGSVNVTLPSSTNLQDGDDINIMNNSDYEAIVFRTSPDSIIFKGNGFTQIKLFPKRNFIKLVVDKANTDWYVANHNLTPNTSTVVSKTLGTAFSEVGASSTAIFLFEDVIKNVYSTYNAVTGKFTPNVAGWYELNANCLFNIAASISSYTIEMALYKNGSFLIMLHTSYPYNGSSEILPMDGNYTFEANGTTDYFEIRLNTYNPQTWGMKGHISYKFIEE